MSLRGAKRACPRAGGGSNLDPQDGRLLRCAAKAQHLVFLASIFGCGRRLRRARNDMLPRPSGLVGTPRNMELKSPVTSHRRTLVTRQLEKRAGTRQDDSRVLAKHPECTQPGEDVARRSELQDKA